MSSGLLESASAGAVGLLGASAIIAYAVRGAAERLASALALAERSAPAPTIVFAPPAAPAAAVSVSAPPAPPGSEAPAEPGRRVVPLPKLEDDK